jgi:peptidylprolyl isomerase/peptidyl-prolyl cis-trans isomerase C
MTNDDNGEDLAFASAAPATRTAPSGVRTYLCLKVALALYGKPPGALSPRESLRVEQVAGRQARIEAAILKSPEALRIIVPEATLTTRLAEIRNRYPDRAEFLADMAANGLDEAMLEADVVRDLVVEAVLERIAAMTPEVTGIEAESYYHRHPQAFTRPETRHLRHILITFSDAGQKQEAMTQLETLRPGIKDAEAFAAAALKHSHCPTALEGGVIGTVKPGQLYPELEAHAFTLPEGGLSTPLESPMGLHLLFCETIHPAVTLGFAESRERIITRLTEERRKENQQQWIRRLLRPADSNVPTASGRVKK